jgi:hypothetical protein
LLELVSVRVGGGSATCPGGAPWPGVPGGVCASATAGDMTATRTIRRTIIANTVRLQVGNVIGLLSIYRVNTGAGQLHSTQTYKDMVTWVA